MVNQVLNWRNWLIGAYIIEFEQGGEDWAEYGEKVIETLANRLKKAGHLGLSLSNLRNFRQLALIYVSLDFRQTLSAVFGTEPTGFIEGIRQTVSGELGDLRPVNIKNNPYDNNRVSQPNPTNTTEFLPKLVHYPFAQKVTPELPWRDGAWITRLFSSLSFSHLLELARVEDPLKRGFYELECIKSGWSVRELKRQRDSLLFERVGLSKDKEAVMALAQYHHPTS